MGTTTTLVNAREHAIDSKQRSDGANALSVDIDASSATLLIEQIDNAVDVETQIVYTDSNKTSVDYITASSPTVGSYTDTFTSGATILTITRS